jgi:hypothetical protein
MPNLAPRIVVSAIAVLALSASALPPSVAAESSCVPSPRANCSGANLAGANLSHADLAGIDLSGTKLIGADLSEADLTGADLSGADVMDAAIVGTNFSGADLSGADFTNSDLDAAVTDAATICPDSAAGPCTRDRADHVDPPDSLGGPEGAASSPTDVCGGLPRPVADLKLGPYKAGERDAHMTLCTGKWPSVAVTAFLTEYYRGYETPTTLFSDGKDHRIVKSLRCDRWYSLTYKDKKGVEYSFLGTRMFWVPCVEMVEPTW